MTAEIEDRVDATARRLAAAGDGAGSSVYSMSWWSEKALERAMHHPTFKAQLFRFVDVFPALDDDAEVAAHLRQYLDGLDVPAALHLGVDVAPHVPFGTRVEAGVARRNIARVARQFILGSTTAEAVEGVARLWEEGTATTVDLLGEKTVVAADADRYAARVAEVLEALTAAAPGWPARPHLDTDDLGPRPRVTISVKPTALAHHYEPLTREHGLAAARARLRPLLLRAGERGAAVHLDMEHAEVKDLTLRLFRDMATDPELAHVDLGVVVQAYLRDSRDDLADLVALSARRPRPITVRLVKGAYWDTETTQARSAGWPVPVYERKEETDANYERCTRLLHDHHGEVRAAFATHNLRSLAHAVEYGRHAGVPDDGYEVQMLHGMAEPLHRAVRELGLRLRVYAPVGELVPGMAYLVRRLLENTSNESFVRHRFAEGADLDQLLARPRVDALPGLEAAPRRPTPVDDPPPHAPEPVREWRRAAPRAAFRATVERAAGSDPRTVPALIAGQQVTTAGTIDSLDPTEPGRVVARSAACGPAEADAAVAAACAVEARWRHTPARERAATLFRAAAWMRDHRDELAAHQVHEVGKPWDQADADVCEAIDFCEHYGRQVLDLAAGTPVDSPPGEANRLTYQGKGVTAVIAPWNFPLAIPCGLVAAAVGAGNPVVLKPAEQAPGVAWDLVRAFGQAGLPDGVLGLVPGRGEEVGARLVEHPDVAVVAFTGSREVGLAINAAAAVTHPGQRHVKRVIAEMGGKNALIVDGDADPDQAIPLAVRSAYGFSGQKCSALSRLIVLDRLWDAVVPRLADAVRELVVGPPMEMGTQVGPVIDAEAHRRLGGVVAGAHRHGTVLVARDDAPGPGCYVGPTLVADVDPSSPLARDEHFGPVLAVLRAADLDEAIALANDTAYALTAGVCSRSPATVERCRRELRAGNVYVNRDITGAVVGRHPFGGYGLSGVGAKAGGPHSLLPYVDTRATSENTVRQGFAPEP
ncbi:MAG TPA: proline dehydrogenase family protein [Acidimicrobiales bacterium]|nr:proline dehydrogenase family protein [Acidimicrobiales bacterium]